MGSISQGLHYLLVRPSFETLKTQLNIQPRIKRK